MSHQIGIIGGDGIGPEVIAEALKVIDATGVEYDATPYDLGGVRYLMAAGDAETWEKDGATWVRSTLGTTPAWWHERLPTRKRSTHLTARWTRHRT